MQICEEVNGELIELFYIPNIDAADRYIFDHNEIYLDTEE